MKTRDGGIAWLVDSLCNVYETPPLFSSPCLGAFLNNTIKPTWWGGGGGWALQMSPMLEKGKSHVTGMGHS